MKALPQIYAVDRCQGFVSKGWVGKGVAKDWYRKVGGPKTKATVRAEREFNLVGTLRFCGGGISNGATRLGGTTLLLRITPV